MLVIAENKDIVEATRQNPILPSFVHCGLVNHPRIATGITDTTTKVDIYTKATDSIFFILIEGGMLEFPAYCIYRIIYYSSKNPLPFFIFSYRVSFFPVTAKGRSTCGISTICVS